MTTTTEQNLPKHLAPTYHALKASKVGIGAAQDWLEATSLERAAQAWSTLETAVGRSDNGRWVMPSMADLIALAKHCGWLCRRSL